MKEVHSIESSLKEIFKIPGDSDFSEASIDSVENIKYQEYNNLPEFIRIGELIPKNDIILKSKIPALIPLKNNNICFFTFKANNELLNKQIELLLLRSILTLSKNMSKLKVINAKKLFLLDKLKKISLDSNIDKKLSELFIEIERVKGLVGNSSIDFYNNNNVVKEPYHFIYIKNFPENFSIEQSHRLLEMIENSKNYGFCFFISLLVDKKPPYGANFLVDFLEHFIGIYQDRETEFFKLKNYLEKEDLFNDNFNLTLEAKLGFEEGLIIEKFFDHTQDELDSIFEISHEVETEDEEKPDFESLVFDKEQLWVMEANYKIKIPMGFDSYSNNIYFTLGQEENISIDSYHALIAGMTGSGKTILLQNIINNIAYFYSPEEIDLILIDYKEGTEFKIYKDLPHIKILSITNERLVGLSILEYLAKEIKRRSELFHQYKNVQDLTSYRIASGENMTRIVVIIDDFQVLFTKKDEISEKITDLFNHILIAGRSFGLNLILSTQSIENNDLNLANIGLRIALKMSEKESNIVLDEDNEDAKYILKKGEGIYNSNNGIKEANLKFYFPNLTNEQISDQIIALKLEFEKRFKNKKKQQIIFDNNFNEIIYENKSLIKKIKKDRFILNHDYCDLYIGKPVFLSNKHSFFRLRSQIESNLLIVGKDVKSVISIFTLALYQLIKQSSKRSKIYILDLQNVDSQYKGVLNSVLTFSENCYIGTTKNISSYIEMVYDEFEKNYELDYRVTLVIFNLNNAKRKLSQTKDPKLYQKFINILCEGPENQIHTMVYSDEYSTFTNLFEADILDEFENKVAVKGGESEKLIKGSPKVDQQGQAILESPHSKYKYDILKVYNHDHFFNVLNEK